MFILLLLVQMHRCRPEDARVRRRFWQPQKSEPPTYANVRTDYAGIPAGMRKGSGLPGKGAVPLSGHGDAAAIARRPIVREGHGTVLASKKTGQDLDGCGMRSGFFAQDRNPVKTSWMRDAIGVFANDCVLHLFRPCCKRKKTGIPGRGYGGGWQGPIH